MGTKVYYLQCKRCGKLSPSPAYFFRKGTKAHDQKELCIWCVDKLFNKGKYYGKLKIK